MSIDSKCHWLENTCSFSRVSSQFSLHLMRGVGHWTGEIGALGLCLFMAGWLMKNIWISQTCLWNKFSSVQFSHSVVSDCDPMNRSTPGLPVHHKLPEFTQTHAHRVSDAIQPSHPLSSPSPPAPNPSQHQGLFQWVNSSHEMAKVLEF